MPVTECCVQGHVLAHSWLDGNLKSTTRVHLVEGLLVVVKLEDVGNHTLGLDFSTVEVGDSTREAVALRERADDLEKYSVNA
jgi:hypothetical protein